MKSVGNLLIGMGLLSLLGAIAFSVWRSNSPAVVSVDSARALSHDFGRAWAGSTVSHVFRVRNDGPAPIEIERVRSTCSCTVPSVPKSIAPGTEVEVPVSITLGNAAPRFEGLVTLTTRAGPPIVLRVTGEVAMRAPHHADFGRFNRGDVPRVTFRVYSRVANPLLIQECAYDTSLLHVEYANAPEDGSAVEFAVSTVAELPEGPFSTPIRLVTNDPEQPRFEIPVLGYVRRSLEPVPRELSFGAIASSGRAEREIELFAPYGDSIERIGLRAEGDGGVEMVGEKPTGVPDRKVIVVGLTPQFQGSFSVGTIHVSAEIGGKRIERPVRYYAIERTSTPASGAASVK